MPRRVKSYSPRLAHCISAVFLCPHCGHRTPVFGDEITIKGAFCKNCRRRFLPLALEKDYRRCEGCRGRLTNIHYREGSRIHVFCPECAQVFDSILGDLERVREGVLRNIKGEIKRKRRVMVLA